jgi:hypothetical protein
MKTAKSNSTIKGMGFAWHRKTVSESAKVDERYRCGEPKKSKIVRRWLQELRSQTSKNTGLRVILAVAVALIGWRRWKKLRGSCKGCCV